jgi:hypothetical protein
MILSYSLGGRIVIKSEDDVQWVEIVSDTSEHFYSFESSFSQDGY